ncbi:MAG: DUF2171 domain-containing protein [Chloroflexota bacterium]|nr:DUF2171 domain-containing protein [Chloroflexota bacterium]
MKRKSQFQKDADVLVATSKQIGQYDQPMINPAIKTISNILTRVGNLFTQDVKSEPFVELMPKAGEKLPVQIQPNVPNEAARKENIKVISSDGMHVGNVERVFADKAFDQITHLLISREIPAQERKLIPIKWVQTMGDAAVHLHVTKDLVEELADASIIW